MIDRQSPIWIYRMRTLGTFPIFDEKHPSPRLHSKHMDDVKAWQLPGPLQEIWNHHSKKYHIEALNRDICVINDPQQADWRVWDGLLKTKDLNCSIKERVGPGVSHTHTHNTVGQPQSGLVTRVKQGWNNTFMPVLWVHRTPANVGVILSILGCILLPAGGHTLLPAGGSTLLPAGRCTLLPAGGCTPYCLQEGVPYCLQEGVPHCLREGVPYCLQESA